MAAVWISDPVFLREPFEVEIKDFQSNKLIRLQQISKMPWRDGMNSPRNLNDIILNHNSQAAMIADGEFI